MIKESVHQEDTRILNVGSPHSRAAKYARQKVIELKREIDPQPSPQRWLEALGRNQ